MKYRDLMQEAAREPDLQVYPIRSKRELNGLLRRLGWVRLALHDHGLYGWDAGDFTHGDYVEHHGEHTNLNVALENGRYIIEFSYPSPEQDKRIHGTTPDELRKNPIFQRVFAGLPVTFRDHDTWEDVTEGKTVQTSGEIMTEVTFTGSQSVQWGQRSDKRWDAFVDVGERQIGIMFNRTSGKARQSAWRVDFLRRTDPETRGTVKETTTILNAVAAAVGEFLDTVQPVMLKMSPTGESREKLYRAVLKRMMPKIDHAYSLDERWYGTLFGEFELTRKPDWLYSGWTT